MVPLVEGKYGHGAVKIGKIHRAIRKITKRKIGRASIPFDWSKGFDIEGTIFLSRKDQGSSSSCSGQAGSYFLEAQQKLSGKNEVLSAKSIYAPIHYKGGGATVNSLETRIAAFGANLESVVPSGVYEPSLQDTSWITQDLLHDAIMRAGYTPYRPDQSNIDSIAEAIRDFNGVIIELSGQNNGTWLSSFPSPPSTNNPSKIWYHFIYFKGAKMIGDKKYLIGLNSWGADVGTNGAQFFSENYLKFFYEVSAFIKDTQLSPLTSNVSVWANIHRWFMVNVFNSTPAMA